MEACVKLFGSLGLWESAVDLALKVDLDVAKSMADKSPENDVELRKKLWLKIGRGTQTKTSSKVKVTDLRLIVHSDNNGTLRTERHEFPACLDSMCTLM